MLLLVRVLLGVAAFFALGGARGLQEEEHNHQGQAERTSSISTEAAHRAYMAAHGRAYPHRDSGTGSPKRPPNIVLIMSDDQVFDDT